MPLPTVKVRRAEIPEYLQHGALYRQLLSDEDMNSTDSSQPSQVGTSDYQHENSHGYDRNSECEEIIEFPAQNIKMDLSIISLMDLQHVLQSMHYWCCERMPPALMQYCLAWNTSFCEVLPVLTSFERDLPCISKLISVINAGVFCPVNSLLVAAKMGELEMLKFRHEQLLIADEQNITGDGIESVMATKSSAGSSVFENQLRRRSSSSSSSKSSSMSGSSMPNLRRSKRTAVAQGGGAGRSPPPPPLSIITRSSLHLDIRVCAEAAATSTGSVECLQYLHQQGFQWDKCTPENALKARNKDCLLYAIHHGCAVDVCKWISVPNWTQMPILLLRCSYSP